jgi:DNA repair protein RecN (Recombination protein N)
VLSNLTIENFAIIDRVDLQLGPGLVALTGETGAGKSIVIDAVSGLLGSRLGPDVVRSGVNVARVEGIFYPPTSPDVRETLDEIGVPADEESIIITREISRNGRSIARINGRAVPVSALQRVGRSLVDLHGQGEHLTILRVAEHVRLLDGYAELDALREEVRKLAETARRLRAEYESYTQDQRELARRVDLLKFQIDEIETARLAPGEDEELRQERLVVANAEKLAVGIDQIRDDLAESDARSAVDVLGRASSVLVDLSRLDPALAGPRDQLEAAIDQVNDVLAELRRYRDEIEFSPERLEEIEERLNLIRSLERKYGSSIEEVLAFAQQARLELDQIEHREERVNDLKAQEATCLANYATAATRLSEARQLAAAALARDVERELAELNMAAARFHVQIRQSADPNGVDLPDGRSVAIGLTGIDEVEFFIATNAGEEPKPLVRVVSGGETARLMLALKAILAKGDPVPTLIFDEIDAGLGGQTAVVVGRKISTLARDRQVICVTHLPQIAAFADLHVSVRKETSEGRTRTDVRTLDAEARERELAGMIGGDAGLASARANARDQLRASTSWKENQPIGRGAS